MLIEEKPEIIALHKVIMFAKFPIENLSIEISTSKVINEILRGIQSELGFNSNSALADFPEYIEIIKRMIDEININRLNMTVESKDILKELVFPFILDEGLENELLSCFNNIHE